jgi:hypothetical protein
MARVKNHDPLQTILGKLPRTGSAKTLKRNAEKKNGKAKGLLIGSPYGSGGPIKRGSKPFQPGALGPAGLRRFAGALNGIALR